MSDQTPSSHICATCGDFHKWPPYVFTHFDIPITHKCGICGRVVKILRGVVDEIKPGEKHASVERARFYGHCRKCRHVNTCNLSTLPARGCANYEEIK